MKIYVGIAMYEAGEIVDGVARIREATILSTGHGLLEKWQEPANEAVRSGNLVDVIHGMNDSWEEGYVVGILSSVVEIELPPFALENAPDTIYFEPSEGVLTDAYGDAKWAVPLGQIPESLTAWDLPASDQ